MIYTLAVELDSKLTHVPRSLPLFVRMWMVSPHRTSLIYSGCTSVAYSSGSRMKLLWSRSCLLSAAHVDLSGLEVMIDGHASSYRRAHGMPFSDSGGRPMHVAKSF